MSNNVFKKLDELNAIGFDSDKLAEIDWKMFYNKNILKTYHHQPNISREIFGDPFPLNWDGRKKIEIPRLNDIGDPVYALDAQYTNDVIDGDTVEVVIPQISKTIKLTREQWAQTFAGRNRLEIWTTQVVAKIAQFENKIAFQGDSKLGVKGAISSDAYDLGNPSGSGLWGVQDANGKLTNAIADFINIRNYFSNIGLGGRPLKIAITSYLDNLFKGTLIKDQGVVTNYDAIMKLLPAGSKIYVSNDIMASPSATNNSVVAFAELMSDEEIAYKTFSSGIRQQVDTGLWGIEYGVQEKFTVKIASSDYVCWMDGISTAAS